MERFDVAIVGAGPAGSCSAIALARKGYAVVLIDKQHFPREKLCGDFLSPVNWPVLKDLGVDGEVLSFDHDRVSAFRITSFLGGSADVPLPEQQGQRLFGLGLSRFHLDRLLLSRAESRGVAVRQGCRLRSIKRKRDGWELETDDSTEPLQARILIGADGRNSWVAHRLGLAPRSGVRHGSVGFQVRLERAPRTGHRVEIHLFPGGYAGLVGLGGGRANLCFAITRDNLAEGASLEFLLRRFLCKNPFLRETIHDSAFSAEVRSIYPVYDSPRRCYGDSLLLVGDAARVTEPVTGEGVYFAMKSGLLAAAEIDAAFCRGDLSAERLRSYAHACRKVFGARRGVNHFIRWLMYRPALLSPVLRFSAKRSEPLAAIVHTVCAPDNPA